MVLEIRELLTINAKTLHELPSYGNGEGFDQSLGHRK